MAAKSTEGRHGSGNIPSVVAAQPGYEIDDFDNDDNVVGESPTTHALLSIADQDVLMSEMSDIAPDLQSTVDADEADQISRDTHVPVVRRYISRPDTTADNIDVDFNMLPHSFTQNNRPARKQAQTLHPPRHEETGSATEASTQSCELPTTVSADRAPSLPTTTKSGRLEVQHARSTTRASSDPGEYESQDKESQHGHDRVDGPQAGNTRPPTNALYAGSENVHITNVPVLVQDRNLMVSPKDIDHSTDGDTVRQSQNGAIANARYESNAENTVQVTVPHPVPQWHASLSREQHEQPLDRSSASDQPRAQKTNSKIDWSTHLDGPTVKGVTTQAASRKMPSEEDFLLLLMHYARQRESAITERQQCQERLEKENQQLRKARVDLQDELKDAIAERDEWLDSTNQARSEIEAFQSKYKKLKTWALEMNNEYAAIRQEGSNIKASLAHLRQQNTLIREPVQHALTSNRQATATVNGVKKNVDDMRQALQTLSEKLNSTCEALAEKRAETRILKSENIDLKTYITTLSTQQKNFSSQTAIWQKHLLGSLDTISAKICSLAAAPITKTDLEEIVEVVKKIPTDHSSSNINLEEVKDYFARVSEQLDSFRYSIEHSLQSYQESNTSSPVIDIGPLKDLIQDLKPDLENLQELQKANARLEEKAGSGIAIQKLNEEAKYAAESRRAEVQKNNDKLIDALATIKSTDDNHRKQATSELQTQLSATLTQLNHARRALEEKKIQSQQQLEQTQSQASQLKAELERQAQINTKLSEDFEQAKHVADGVPSLQHNIAEKTGFIAKLRDEVAKLEVVRIEHESTLTKLEAQKEMISTLTKKLNEAEEDSRRLEESHQKTMKSQNEKLEELNAQLGSLSELEQTIGIKDRDISRLNNLLEDVQDQCKKLEAAKVERDELEKQVNDLQQELSDAKQRSEQTAQPLDLDVHGVFTQNTHISSTSQGPQGGQAKLGEDQTMVEQVEQGQKGLFQTINPKMMMKAASSVESASTIGTFTTPHSQTSIVPDTQLDAATKTYKDIRIEHSQGRKGSQDPSSPLSDVNEDFLYTDHETDSSESDHEQIPKQRGNSHRTIDIFDIPIRSPPLVRHKTSRRLSRHSSSVMSQDDTMLLQASESGRHSSSQSSTTHHHDPVATSTVPRPAAVQHHTLSSTTSFPSPRRLRSVSYSQTFVADSTSAPLIPLSLRAASREPNRPNSAAKRSIDDISANPNERFADKRLRLSPDRTETRSVGETRRRTATTTSTTSHRFPPASRESVIKKNAKRPHVRRKQSKQNRYAERFSHNSQP